MENETIFFPFPSGEVAVRKDGSDFCELPIEKQKEICFLINSHLERGIPDVTAWEDDYKGLFLLLLDECYSQAKARYKRENREKHKKGKDSYEHVNSPSHYNSYQTEVIDMMVRIWGKEKVADFCEINAFKYRMRMGTKPDNSIEQDLKKEQWYLNKAKELRNEN